MVMTNCGENIKSHRVKLNLTQKELADKPGFEYLENSIDMNGPVEGHISTHEEIFMIRRMLTYKKYSPTVHFVYSPCDYAIRSVVQFRRGTTPDKFHLLSKDEIKSGGESVGIIIQGKRFKTRYYGNYLDTTKLNETATILQVSGSSYAAFCYMMNHPKEGMTLPEDVDELEILETAKKYLGGYSSFETKKLNMKLGK